MRRFGVPSAAVSQPGSSLLHGREDFQIKGDKFYFFVVSDDMDTDLFLGVIVQEYAGRCPIRQNAPEKSDGRKRWGIVYGC
jgi:hypothetical protein